VDLLFDVDELRAALAVGLDHVDLLGRGVPGGCARDVGRDLIDPVTRRVDLDGVAGVDRSHG
jgi:hypothetical protein